VARQEKNAKAFFDLPNPVRDEEPGFRIQKKAKAGSASPDILMNFFSSSRLERFIKTSTTRREA
jgi:hypothetical protein